ncbi:MAG: hypothetical protein MI802_10735 [Desulfobacterales bacterium]|nr:hypothetical protein [Desulfobacterales bacterium]
MKKILIGAHNLEKFLKGNTLCLSKEHILSPGARDAARNRGISIIYGNAPCADKTGSENREELSRRIVTLLRTDFNLTDPEVIKNVTLEVLRRIETEK